MYFHLLPTELFFFRKVYKISSFRVLAVFKLYQPSLAKEKSRLINITTFFHHSFLQNPPPPMLTGPHSFRCNNNLKEED